MSLTQHTKLNRQVVEHIKKRLVREIMSHCVILTLLTPSKGSEWNMCTNSREIKRVTIKYRFPIPCFDDMMDVLVGACSSLTVTNFSHGYKDLCRERNL